VRTTVLLFVACQGEDGTEGQDGTGEATGDTGSAYSPFSVFADQIPGGTLLGAWSSGDELLMVGGDLGLDGSDTIGNLVRWDGATLCVEEGVTDATLWWIHGPREGEWYAVGAKGRILHEVDSVRTDESVPTDSTLYGVWVAEDGRVWAVGGDPRGTLLGEIWLREAGTWSLFAGALPGTIFKVWDRWFVGDGVVYHLEGDALVEHNPPDVTKLLTVRGRADDDVYAVGGSSNPALLHWDGLAWSSVEVDLTCTGQPLNGVWTAPGEDVWIAGNTGAMARWDGAEWTCPFPPITFEHFHAVWSHGGDWWWAGGNLFSPGGNYGTIGRWSESAPELHTVEACGGG